VIYYNASGKLVYHIYDDTDTAYASAIEEYLSGHPEILKHTTTSGSRIGIVALKNSNFLVASKPIVTSNGDGPIAGTLVFVKKFGSEEAKNLSELTHIDLKLHPFGSQEPTTTDIRQNLLRQPFVVQYQSENVIVGHALLKDISNEPAIVVEIQMERKVYLQGKQTTFYFMIIAGLFIVFFGIVMIVLIEKTIIQRLTLVKKQTFEIGKSKDLSKRIAVTGDDEIASLSRSINTMLDDLKNSESTKVEVMKSNAEMSNKLSERLLEMEKINTLMVGREIKMIELKRRIKELEKEIKSKLKK
jgi:methyl-accepting chemotaxis protein